MTTRTNWTRQQLLVAFSLYCQIPFGRNSARNPDIVRVAGLIGRSPASLSMKMGNIASLDPAITSTGRVGLRNASAADRAMWEEMNADWERFANEAQKALQNLQMVGQSAVSEAIPEIEDSQREGIDRPVETTARVGQSFFRSAVLSAYSERCCITGLSVPGLLVASHIVPWSHDPVNRVNPRNGLLLSALHDRAFDAGLLTTNDDMTVRVSPAYSDDGFFSTSVVAYHGQPIRLPEKFAPDREFLAYHREQVFLG